MTTAVTTDRTSSRRSGFTIVEVLIVIIIIMILAGLLLPAVLAALKQAKVTATRFEIQTLSIALDAYQGDFGTYPPSSIWWRDEDAADPDPWAQEWDDRTKWRWYTSEPPDIGTTIARMNGAECLVYFLCSPGQRGHTVGAKTYGPYSTPKANTLFLAYEPPPSTDRRPYQSIIDAIRLDCAYLYFKADRTRGPGDEYNLLHNNNIADAGGSGPSGRIPPAFGEPQRDASGNPYNPTTYQIISAGLDCRYGTEDDITNVRVQ